jgi:hypothetical protein
MARFGPQHHKNKICERKGLSITNLSECALEFVHDDARKERAILAEEK